MGFIIDEDNLNKCRKQTLNDIIELLKTNDRVMCNRYTGFGKSYYIISELIEYYNTYTIILVPSIPLKTQYESQYKDNPMVLVDTYQSLKNKGEKYLKDKFIKYKYIICDECHHLGKNKWRKEFDRVNSIIKAKVIGLTATPLRGDNVDVCKEYFNNVQVKPLDLFDGIKNKFVPKINYIVAYADIDDKYNSRLSDVDRYELGKLLQVEDIIEKHIDKHKLSKNLKILVYVPQIKHIEEAVRSCGKWFGTIYPSKRLNIYSISSVNDRKVNTATLEAFKNNTSANDIDILVSVDMIVEGLHLPNISVELMLRKTRSNVKYFQQLGRVINDEQPVVFDLVNNSKGLLKVKMDYDNLFNVKGTGLTRLDKVTFDEFINLVDETKSIEELLNKYRQMKVIPKEIVEAIINDNRTYREIADEYNLSPSTVSGIKQRAGIRVQKERRYFTDEERKAIAEDTRNYDVIKDDYNCSIAMIYKIKHLYGVTKPLPRLEENIELIKQDLKYVEDNNGVLTITEMAKHFGLNTQMYSRCLNSLGIKPIRKVSPIKIEKQRIEQFIDVYNKYHNRDIVMKKLNLTEFEYNTFLRKTSRNKQQTRNKRESIKQRWTQEDKDFMIKNSYNMTAKEVAEKLGKNAENVRAYLKRNNIPYIKRENADRVLGNEEIEQKIVESYKELGSLYKVSTALGYHKSTVKKVVQKHGLKINKPTR